MGACAAGACAVFCSFLRNPNENYNQLFYADKVQSVSFYPSRLDPMNQAFWNLERSMIPLELGTVEQDPEQISKLPAPGLATLALEPLGKNL